MSVLQIQPAPFFRQQEPGVLEPPAGRLGRGLPPARGFRGWPMASRSICWR